MSETERAPRLTRGCDLCPQVDDHPRHHQVGPDGDQSAHLDCCAGTGCISCGQQLEAARVALDGRPAHGQALIDHLSALSEKGPTQ